MTLRWYAADKLEVSADGAFASHHGTRGKIMGVAYPVMKEDEQHTFCMTIDRTLQRDGNGMLLGVADASSDASWAWGVSPDKGIVYFVDGSGEKKVKELWHDYYMGSEGAKGAVIEIHVNMEERRLSFSINRSPAVDAGVQLPETVQPWVRLCWPRDTVKLSQYRGPAIPMELKAAKEEAVKAEQAKEEAEAMARKAEENMSKVVGRAWRVKAFGADADEEFIQMKEELKKAKVEAENRAAAAEKAAEQLQEQCEQLRAQASEGAETKDQTAKLEEQVKLLKQQMETAADQAKNELNALKQELESSVEKRSQAEQSAESLAREVKAMHEKTGELQQQLAQAHAAAEAAKDEQEESAPATGPMQLLASPISCAMGPLMRYGATVNETESGYKCMAASGAEAQMIAGLWARSGARSTACSFALKRMEAIDPGEEQEEAFDRKVRQLDSLLQRAGNGRVPEAAFQDPDGDKKAVTAKLGTRYTRTDALRFAKLLFVFYGCPENEADVICTKGFHKSKPEDGTFGKGFSVSTHAELVGKRLLEKASPNENGEYVMIVSWAVPGLVYPISKAVDYSDGVSKFQGKRLKPPFTSHYALVQDGDFECMEGVARKGAPEPDYDTLVIQDGQQMLPAYRLYFTRS